jgi:hypothetical protein
MRTSPKLLLAALCMLLVVGLTPVTQAQDQSATEFYMAYRAAFAKATKIEDVTPYMSKATLAQMNETPAAERAKMFGMIKMMDRYTNVKVVKETKTAQGVTLSVEGVDDKKAKATATVEIVKEGTAWKLGRESWKGSF